jgi:hypothetical protein
MLSPPINREWAHKLIASEVDVDSPSVYTEGATIRVYEKLRRQFCAPVGADAFQALVSRALSVAKSQFPGLDAVSVTADGDLCGLDEVDNPINSASDGEVGFILIAQMLRLFMTLLGEEATVRLIEDASHHLDVEAGLDIVSPTLHENGTNYLGPFRDISLEADQLRLVSERLEALTNTTADVDELFAVAGNLRAIATVLDIFILVRSKAGGSHGSVLVPPTNDYQN